MRILFTILILRLIWPGSVATCQQPAAQQRPASIFDDLPVDNAATRSVLSPHENPQRKIRDNVFVAAAFDKTSCYLGEQIMVTYRLYTALQSTSTILTQPSLEGFSSRENDPGEEDERHKEIAGKEYRVFTIWQVRLTPLQTGRLTLDPLQVSNEVSYTAADDRVQSYSGSVASNRPVITVLPLPAAGRPGDFTGAVGRFRLQGRLMDPTVAVGEIDTLHLEVVGAGNFDNLPVPAVQWPEGVHALAPVEKWFLRKNIFPPAGEKTFDIPFIAAHPGHFVLPPVILRYFDPATSGNACGLARTESLSIRVTQAAPTAARTTDPGGTKGITSGSGHRPGWKSLLLFFMVMSLLVIIIVLARHRSMHRDAVTESPVELSTDIIKAPDFLAQLSRIDADPDTLSYISELKKLLLAFLRQELNVDMSAEEDLINLLQEKDSLLAVKARAALASCNELLYSPFLVSSEIRSELSSGIGDLLGRQKADASAAKIELPI